MSGVLWTESSNSSAATPPGWSMRSDILRRRRRMVTLAGGFEALVLLGATAAVIKDFTDLIP